MRMMSSAGGGLHDDFGADVGHEDVRRTLWEDRLRLVFRLRILCRCELRDNVLNRPGGSVIGHWNQERTSPPQRD
jgi:hypothetical protein